MAFVGLDASVITVIVSCVARSHLFYTIPAKAVFSAGFCIAQTRAKQILFCLFFRLSIVQGFKGFRCGIKGCSKSLSALPFTPTWGYNVKHKENIVRVEWLIIETLKKY